MNPVFYEVLIFICGIAINIICSFYIFGRYTERVDSAVAAANDARQKAENAQGRVAHVEGELSRINGGRH